MRITLIGCLIATSLISGIAGENDPFDTQALVTTPSLLACHKIDMTRPLSLEDVVNQALCNNPQTKIAWQAALYQASLVGANQSSFLPTLSATGSIAQVESSEMKTGNQDNASLTLSYLLYDFGKRDATLENAKQLLNAALASQDSTIQSVFLQAVQSYYALFGAQASLEAFQEAEQYAKESLNAANTRLRVGTTTKADMLQAQTAYSQAMLNRIKAQGSVKSAQGALASAMNLAPDDALALQQPSLKPPTEEFTKNIHTLMQEAQGKHPDLLAAQAKIKAYEASVKAAKADNMPTFSLSSSVGNTDTTVLSHSSRTSSIGLYVSIPIFTGYNTKYKIQAAQEQLRQSEAEYEKLSHDVALDVYQTYQTLMSETQAIDASRDLVVSAEASHDMAMGRYKAGVGSILDLLNAQSALASARQEYVQSLYNWYITKAALAKAMGGLDFSQLKGH